MCIGKTKYTTPCYLVLSGGIVYSVSLYFFYTPIYTLDRGIFFYYLNLICFSAPPR